MTNKQKLENLGINCSKMSSSGKTTCPKCSHTRKNKKDECLSVDVVYRNFQTNCTEIHVEKMKYEHLGGQGKIELQFNMNNSRYIVRGAEWDNTNWLLSTVQSDMFEAEIPIIEIPVFNPSSEIEVSDLPF